MTKPRSNALAAGLDGLVSTGNDGTVLKIDQLFSDQPDVLEAIKRARVERRLGYTTIAGYLTKNGYKVGHSAVKRWLEVQGID
jgi:hypothetical protein